MEASSSTFGYDYAESLLSSIHGSRPLWIVQAYLDRPEGYVGPQRYAKRVEDAHNSVNLRVVPILPEAQADSETHYIILLSSFHHTLLISAMIVIFLQPSSQARLTFTSRGSKAKVDVDVRTSLLYISVIAFKSQS